MNKENKKGKKEKTHKHLQGFIFNIYKNEYRKTKREERKQTQNYDEKRKRLYKKNKIICFFFWLEWKKKGCEEKKAKT